MLTKYIERNSAMKKLLCLVLSLLMIVPVSLVGCGGDGDDTTVPTITVDVKDERLPLEVPEVVIPEDKVFKIVGQGDGDGWKADDILCPEEDSDDVLESAKYTRYKNVEEMLGIEIDVYLNPTIYNTVQASVQSNDKGFDLVFMTVDNASNAAISDLLYNINDIESIKTESPWYDQGYVEGLSVGDEIYSLVTSVGIYDTYIMYILMYNKRLIQTYGLDDPYQMVKENRWTYDNFVAMLEGISTDNGNSVWGPEDTYAFAAHPGSAGNFFYASGLKICEKDDANLPVMAVENNSKAVALQEKLIKLLFEENTTMYAGVAGFAPSDCINAFMSGRLLFMGEIVGYLCTTFREMEDDFGVVPYPKYDASQSRYYTTNDTVINVMCVPRFIYTEEELEVLGTITETICWESYYTVRPAFYEDVLGGKGTRDEGSYEMLDLCRESRVYDFGLFNRSIDLSNLYRDLISNKTTKYSSTVKRNIKQSQVALDEIIASYTDNT